jgi:hypothetical protein
MNELHLFFSADYIFVYFTLTLLKLNWIYLRSRRKQIVIQDGPMMTLYGLQKHSDEQIST